jgi:DNA-directed RNA polymerase subunit RPC12/RpoP
MLSVRFGYQESKFMLGARVAFQSSVCLCFVAFLVKVFCCLLLQSEDGVHVYLLNSCLWEKGFVVSSLYLIVVCDGCGRLLVADGGKKSRRCPYCGVRVWLSRARVVGNAGSAREALVLVQRLKRERDGLGALRK